MKATTSIFTDCYKPQNLYNTDRSHMIPDFENVHSQEMPFAHGFGTLAYGFNSF